MTDTAKPKRGKRSRVAQGAQNTRILAKSIEGKTTIEIAKEEGISRQAVSHIINKSPEAVEYSDRIRQGFESLVDRALETIERVVTRDEPISDPSALKAALSVIDRIAGKVPDKVELKDEFNGLTRQELLALLKRELQEAGE